MVELYKPSQVIFGLVFLFFKVYLKVLRKEKNEKGLFGLC